MDASLQLPLSAVPGNWLKAQLFPRVSELLENELREGGVLCIGTDHPDEASLVIERLLRELGSRRQSPPLRYVISRPDPLLFWEEVLGTTDASGHLLTQSWQDQLVMVHDAFYLPADSMLNRGRGLHWLCKGARCVLVFAIGHPALEHLSSRTTPLIKVAVPRFADASQLEIEALSDRRIRDSYPETAAPVCATLAARLAGTHRPASRTDLERWIDEEGASCIREAHVTGADIGNLLERRPPNRLLHIATAPTRETLQLRWNRSLMQMEEVDRHFCAWSGRSLMQPLQELHHPFDSIDPIHWFTGMVSYLACQLFDRMDTAFPRLLKCHWVSESETLEERQTPEAYQVLRTLRTTMQHGMSPSDETKGSQRVNAGNWYYKHCQMRHPKRPHFRLLCNALLTDWESLVHELGEIMRNIPRARNRSAIERQIDMERRQLSQHEWRLLMRKIITEMAPTFDVEQVLRRRQSSLSKKLAGSLVTIEQMPQQAEVLVREAVQDEVERQRRALAKFSPPPPTEPTSQVPEPVS